jgi:hypothetical protein
VQEERMRHPAGWKEKQEGKQMCLAQSSSTDKVTECGDMHPRKRLRGSECDADVGDSWRVFGEPAGAPAHETLIPLHIRRVWCPELQKTFCFNTINNVGYWQQEEGILSVPSAAPVLMSSMHVVSDTLTSTATPQLD